ncbi:MAG: cupin domain-containing protein [Thermoplasmata archaeon]|nr:cupin domain-containing protein [Thermoplasmata archaeon]
MGDGTGAWHRDLRHVPSAELSEATTQTPGMRRFEAISGAVTGSEKIWIGQTHLAAGVGSANHHHGESETGIYVLSGHPVFVFAEHGVERRIAASPGDYVFVPPYTPHREENPGDDEAVVILARSTQQAIVVNLDSLVGADPPEAPSA